MGGRGGSHPNFYPRPPRGGRPKCVEINGVFKCISIHALREEGDTGWRRQASRPEDFYPRPPRGGRRFTSVTPPLTTEFLSTPSARRATSCRCPASHRRGISIHALREEGDAASKLSRLRGVISIHALREEGDSHRRHLTAPSSYFYPRPPRGGRLRETLTPMDAVKFLSTPSARRATPAAVKSNDNVRFLSTPSARRATRRRESSRATKGDFYPRPPRGGRPAQRGLSTRHCYFYPRPPRGGRRPSRTSARRWWWISIHALREEGD